ncbi:V-type proton ATPase subunit e-like isoform X1 [Bolinopsis microptera]|uniref:V-type proton ATPase subunit e-like isoform X1 n=2 Tax=Bolinopsis microptera TaxID=2820187 RepID=UPI00307AB332
MALSPPVAITIGTLFWVAFALIGFFSAARISKENTQLIWVMSFLTAFCCWLSWFCTYAAQINPLIGPEINGAIVMYYRAQNSPS